MTKEFYELTWDEMMMVYLAIRNLRAEYKQREFEMCNYPEREKGFNESDEKFAKRKSDNSEELRKIDAFLKKIEDNNFIMKFEQILIKLRN